MNSYYNQNIQNPYLQQTRNPYMNAMQSNINVSN